MLTPDDAAKIIGEQPDGDYSVNFAAHPDRYAESAPKLAALLRSTKIKLIREEFDVRDSEAATAQVTYRRNMQRANLAILVAAGLGALMMAAQIVFGSYPFAPYLVGGLGLLSAVSGAMAAMWLFRVRNGEMLNEWMEKRASAETQRLSYFTAIAAPSGDAAPNTDLNLLRLEYFRRYQLDVQRAYYRVCGERHHQAADRTLNLGSYAVVLSALASLATGVAGALSGIATALGVAGVFAAAVSSYANARESMSQDRRNAERFARTREALVSLTARLDEVRDAVSKGNERALAEFVSAINDQVSLEHRQWLEATEATKEATARLDEALSTMQRRTAKLEPADAGPKIEEEAVEKSHH